MIFLIEKTNNSTQINRIQQATQSRAQPTTVLPVNPSTGSSALACVLFRFAGIGSEQTRTVRQDSAGLGSQGSVAGAG